MTKTLDLKKKRNTSKKISDYKKLKIVRLKGRYTGSNGSLMQLKDNLYSPQVLDDYKTD